MFTLIVVLILGLMIVFFEIWRWRKIKFIDFLRGFNIVYFIIYFLAPSYIILFDFKVDSLPPSSMWIFNINYKDAYWSFLASVISVIGFFCTVVGYYLGLSIFRNIGCSINFKLNKISDSYWLLLSIIVLFFGFFSLGLYIYKRSAPLFDLIMYSGLLRSGIKVKGVEETSFTFLTFSLIVTFSSYVLLGLSLNKFSSFKKRFLYFLGFGISGILSLLVLILKAGRLHLINYLLVVFLTLYSTLEKRIFRILFLVLSLGVSLSIILYGKYWFGIRFGKPVYNSLQDIFSNFFAEFSFPYLSLINILCNVPIKTSYRYFLDFPLGILRIPLGLISKILDINIDFPLTLSQENTLIILGTEKGGIPVDILGAGYFSANIFGVVFIMFCLGMLLALFERIFSNVSNPVLRSLKIAWILYFSTMVVLYADPAILLWDGVYLIFPTIVFLILYLLLNFKKYSF
ncbi:LOW QUALITY PROTEIN: hypothetical protein ThesiDRAFT1_1781 [Thermoanaerobacter siderophilus SR4]|uniref:Oligosaccharide repeat unit polymerase n=1 Tax=Thermoanaerobacter siderophilus SR4 TaxID=880478 RepID=I8R5D3_9THEO|nr:LOW QUALITY PROTEIN: hypothetical protein ThesiDRAFT1_1781 [Thermoanaerobacter siderophilus SR4]